MGINFKKTKIVRMLISTEEPKEEIKVELNQEQQFKSQYRDFKQKEKDMLHSIHAKYDTNEDSNEDIKNLRSQKTEIDTKINKCEDDLHQSKKDYKLKAEKTDDDTTAYNKTRSDFKLEITNLKVEKKTVNSKLKAAEKVLKSEEKLDLEEAKSKSKVEKKAMKEQEKTRKREFKASQVKTAE